MLNINEIIKRIEEVRNNHQLSAAAFATKIGVQRSAMSHILSGRNKPSLDFLMKVYEAFEEVELQWLVVGTPPSSNSLKENSDLFDTLNITPKNLELLTKSNTILDQVSIPKEVSIRTEESASPKEIIYLYTDGSFERFTPKK